MKRWKIVSGGDVFKIGDIVERVDGQFGTIVKRVVGQDAFHYLAELVEEMNVAPPPPPPPTRWQRVKGWLTRPIKLR